jgi:DNA-binding CsgD family transcriptional regulator
LLDRATEISALEGLLAAVQDGLSGVLVLRGDAGIGKTALLEWAAGRAEDVQLARVAGIQAEMGMGFAGLHQLLVPFLGGLEQLPGPQRQALGSAFGLVDGPAPDRFLVGLAALTLLTDAAAGRPVLCLVDDAQWLDQVSVEVLGFIARRLYADRVGVLFTVREGEGRVAALAGLPELVLGGLPGEAAGALLATSAGGRVDGRVSAQVVAGVAGNPLALVELAGELTAGELSGAVPLGWPLRFGGRLEELYLSRVRALPGDTRTVLLVAAADPTGDPVLVYRAAEQLGTGPEAGEAAGTGRLVSWQPGVRFRHPLIRSAAYYAAPPGARRRAHAALAAVTDRDADPDRRAWHLAEAAPGPDEEVAAELERSAGRAQARGGLAAAAAFLERSVLLTADPARHAERVLAAAQASMQAGAFGKALELLATAEAGPLDEFASAHVDLLRGRIAFASRRGSDAPPLLLKAARSLELLDARLARETYLEALFAALFAGRLALGGGAREVAEAARAVPSPQQPARAPDLLLDGLALVVTEGYPAGAPVLKRAVSAFRSADVSREEGRHWLWLSQADLAAGLLWDYESWDLLSARRVKLARDAGALTALPFAATIRAGVHLWAGEFAAAATLVAEVESVTEATGSSIAPTAAVALAAFTGREADAAELIEVGTKDAERRGEGRRLTFFHWATAVLCNSLGRYADALAAAQQASEDSPADLFAAWALAELIEAAARSGAPDRAAGPLQRLSATARASGTDWALGVEARCRALLSEGAAAEACYREAIGRLGRTRVRTELARAHLLYGEWLRRARRRIDAREQLRLAHQMFDAMGMAAFAERAGRELRATGERARPRSPGAAAVLTPQEEQIARLVAGHLTNREIAARLFISASTVEYHLRKIFRKLDIASRAQLARTLGAGKQAAAPRG